MRPLPLALLTLTTVAIAGTASSGVIRHDRDLAPHLKLAEHFSQVGQVRSVSEHDVAHDGSGTLVGARHVLTAAHLIQDGSTNFTLDGQTYTAAEIHLHPQWDGRVYNGYDAAIVKLDRPVSAPAQPARLWFDDPIGSEATFVGYGRTGDGLSGYGAHGGQRIAGRNTLDTRGDDFWFLLDQSLVMADFDYTYPLDLSGAGHTLGGTDIPTMLTGLRHINRMGDGTPLDMEYLPAIGDSGGGVFIDTPDGPALAGVISMTLAWDGSRNSGYTDMAGIIPLGELKPWINETIPQPHLLPRVQLPEPGTLTILSLGLGLMKRHRLRKAHTSVGPSNNK